MHHFDVTGHIMMWHNQEKWFACQILFNFEFSTPLSGKLKLLHFDTNPIIWLQSCEQFIMAENYIIQKNLNPFLADIFIEQYLRHLTHSPWSCHIHIGIRNWITLWLPCMSVHLVCVVIVSIMVQDSETWFSWRGDNRITRNTSILNSSDTWWMNGSVIFCSFPTQFSLNLISLWTKIIHRFLVDSVSTKYDLHVTALAFLFCCCHFAIIT